MTDVQSKYVHCRASVLVDHFRTVAADAGLLIYAVVDHGRDMADRGVEMPPTAYTVIFGNPVAGAKVLKGSKQAVVDIPLRIGIFEQDDKSESVIVWRSMRKLLESHDEADLSVIGEAMDNLMESLVSKLDQVSRQ